MVTADRVTCPYNDYTDSAFWVRAVSGADPDAFDPVVSVKFTIGLDDKVATAGSCFARNIGPALKRSGYRYFVPEDCPSMFPDSVKNRFSFGVFSCRYGNVNTARQLVQLFDRAWNKWVPEEPAWRSGDRIVDPFRPYIQPHGFRSLHQLNVDRTQHFRAVRAMFEQCSVFVYTLGLTEAWVSRIDGAVFPVCPGCGAGIFDKSKYEFRNFSYAEVLEDMHRFVGRIRSVNSAARILLTVSPVALAATAEARHVVVSTLYSKAVLRAVAGDLEKSYPFLDYFPAYEIIAGPQAGGRFHDRDRWGVTDDGVAAVMRVMMKHYGTGASRVEQPGMGTEQPLTIVPDGR
jgi:GSCFA family